MPHGSRLTSDGRRQYSVCMMDDLLVEVDAWSLEVSHHFHLTPGREHGMAGPPGRHGHGGGHGHTPDHGDPDRPEGAGEHGVGRDHGTCSPTWVQPSPDGRSVFVACNRSAELVQVDVEGWTLARRIPSAPGIYNVDVTSDGRLLVATNKQDHSVSIFDLETGQERVRASTHRRVVHGVAISPDDRYAFITVEGVGAEPGTLEVLDLDAGAFVARVDLPQMSAGVAFWK
jgi:hypothetical protein